MNKTAEQTPKDQSLAQQVATLKSELQQAHRELKEFRLWRPLREIALKSGLYADEWDVVRLDLVNQKRFDLDEGGEIIVLDGKEQSHITPERFFKEIYKAQRPRLFRDDDTAKAAKGQSGKGKKTISRYDQAAMNANFEAIASGEIEVVD